MADTFNKLEQDSLAVASETGFRKNTSFRIGNLFYRILQFFKNLFGGTYLLGEKANEAEIKEITNAVKGDTWKALDTGHYWTYNGKEWNDIGVVLPSDAVTLTNLQEKATANNPFISTVKGSNVMPLEQWRSFILGLELDVEYDPSLYYSPAIISYSEDRKILNILIYSFPEPDKTAGFEKIAEFNIPLDDSTGIKYHRVANNFIVVDTRFAPAERIESQVYNIAGLSPSVFVKNNNVYVEGYKNQLLSKQYLVGNRMQSLPVQWLAVTGYWGNTGDYVPSSGYYSTSPISVKKGKHYCVFSILTSTMSIVKVDAAGNFISVLKTGNIPYSNGHSASLNVIYVDEDCYISYSVSKDSKDATFIVEVNSNFTTDIYKSINKTESNTIDVAKALDLIRYGFIGNRTNIAISWMPDDGYWNEAGVFTSSTGYSTTTPIMVKGGKYYSVLSLLTSTMSIVKVDADGNFIEVVKTGNFRWATGHGMGYNVFFIEEDCYISYSTPNGAKEQTYIVEVNSNLISDIYINDAKHSKDIANLNHLVNKDPFLEQSNISASGVMKADLRSMVTGIEIHGLEYYEDGYVTIAITGLSVVNGQPYIQVFEMHENPVVWGNNQTFYIPVNEKGEVDTSKKFRVIRDQSSQSFMVIDTEAVKLYFEKYPLKINSLHTIGGLSPSVMVEDSFLEIQTYKAGSISSVHNAFLPPKIYATVGLELNLYYDTFILCPEYGSGHPTFMFDIDCAKGLMDKRSFRFTPTIDDIGEYDFTLKMLNNNSETVKTYTSKLIVVPSECPAKEMQVVMLGDSTWDNQVGEITRQLQSNLAECSGTTPIFLGTHQSVPAKNEARTGKTYNHFANGDVAHKFYFDGVDPNLDLSNINKLRDYYYNTKDNAILMLHRWVINPDGTGYAIGYHWDSFTPPSSFPATLTPTNSANPVLNVTRYERLNSYSILKDNEGEGNLSFSYYRTEILGLASEQKIDVLITGCGINDLSGTLFTDNQIANVVNNTQKLIDNFLEDNPNGKVILCLPKSRNSDLRKTTRDMLRYNIFNYSKKLIETFTDNSGVIISQGGLGVDRFYGYPLIELKVANRFTETQLTVNDDVHPRLEGSRQEADSVTGSVLAGMSKL